MAVYNIKDYTLTVTKPFCVRYKLSSEGVYSTSYCQSRIAALSLFRCLIYDVMMQVEVEEYTTANDRLIIAYYPGVE